MIHKTIAASLSAACLSALCLSTTVATATPGTASTTTDLAQHIKPLNDAAVTTGFNASVVGLRTPDKAYFHQSGDISHPGSSLRGLATQARFGSLTKLYVAALVMSQIDRSNWTLNTTIADVAPHLAVDRQDVTIEQLLSHHSGIPEMYYAPDSEHTYHLKPDHTHPALDPTAPHTPTDLLATSNRYEWQFEPGTQHRYTNANFIVLGELLRAATGKSPNQLLRERITQPLGLQQTWFANAPGLPNAHIEEFVIVGHERAPFPEFDPSFFGVAGNIVTTPAEATRFLQGLASGNLVSESSFQELITARHISTQEPHLTVAYGLGTLTIDFQCTPDGPWAKTFGHNGLTLGTASLAMARRDGTSAFATAHAGRNYNVGSPDAQLAEAADQQDAAARQLQNLLLVTQCPTSPATPHSNSLSMRTQANAVFPAITTDTLAFERVATAGLQPTSNPQK